MMDVEPSFRMADPMEGTHRGGMLRPSMLPIKPQPAMVPCCPPQHPKTPPQPIIGHRCGPVETHLKPWITMVVHGLDVVKARPVCCSNPFYSLCHTGCNG